MLTYKDLRENPEVQIYIQKANDSLRALGYTEHGFAHVGRVAEMARYILETMEAEQRQVELVQMAAYLHDIGNLINREDHSQSGAMMAFRILREMDMSPEEVATIVTAIGNHDEGTGVAVNPVAAALILADKCDVRRSRVQNPDIASFDIHDRVNYSVTESALEIDKARSIIRLRLTVDTRFSAVMDYFEIFMARMNMCRKAALTLGLAFKLTINDQPLL